MHESAIPPLVSICIPTFNGERYIAEALLSAVSQTYGSIEIVVSDSGSTDRTVEVCRQLARDASRPVRIDPNGPKGMVPNWNHVAQLSRGRWIKFLFQDDMLEPNCVDRFVAAVAPHPRAAFAYSRRRVLFEGSDDAASQHIAAAVESLHRQQLPPVVPGRLALGSRTLFNPVTTNSIGEPTNVFVRRDVFDHEQFNPDLCQLVDFEMWLRCYGHGDVVFVPDKLSTFRVHCEQMSFDNHHRGDQFWAHEWRCFCRGLVDSGVYRHLHYSIRRRLRGEMMRDDQSYAPPLTLSDRALFTASAARHAVWRLTNAVRLGG